MSVSDVSRSLPKLSFNHPSVVLTADVSHFYKIQAGASPRRGDGRLGSARARNFRGCSVGKSRS